MTPTPTKVIRRRPWPVHLAQKRFLLSTAIGRGFVGGRGAGKTWVGAYDLLCRARPGRTYLIGSPTSVIMGDTTFPTFEKLAKDTGSWGKVRLSPYPTVTLARTGATVRFRTAEDPEKMRGPNLSGVWLDEASLMPREAFTICMACLREEGRQGWMSATFTPKGMAHWTYKVFGGQYPDFEIFHARTKDNPFLPADFVGLLSGIYTDEESSQELEGHFLDTDDGWQVIPTAWVRAAMQRWLPGPPEGFPLSGVGVDVARGGRDRTVIARRYLTWFAPLIKIAGDQTPDGPTAATRVLAVCQNPPQVNVDVIGIGASVYDLLKAQLGGKVVSGVNNAEATDMRDKSGRLTFTNVRAASYWRFREALDPDGPEKLALPPDKDLLAELTAARYKVLASGIQLEPKDDITERLGRSPDCADAAVLALWAPPKRRLWVG